MCEVTGDFGDISWVEVYLGVVLYIFLFFLYLT